jgi:hypothetical protein
MKNTQKNTHSDRHRCCAVNEGKQCRRRGVWFLRYLIFNQPEVISFCESCAADRSYKAFGRSLLKA